MSTTVSGQSVRRTKSTRTFTKYLAAIAGTVALVAASLAFGVPSANADESDPQTANHVPITICHATDSRTNPYVLETVDDDSITREHGHSSHTGEVFSPTMPKHEKWGDIIPVFPGFGGLNLASLGYIATGCNVPGQPTPTGITTLTCDAGWSVSLTNYAVGDEVKVYLGSAMVAETTIGSSMAFSASNTAALTPGTYTLKVKVDSHEVNALTKTVACVIPPNHQGSSTLDCVAGWTVRVTGYTDLVGKPVKVTINGSQVGSLGAIATDGTFSRDDTTKLGTGARELKVLVNGVEVSGATKSVTCAAPPGPSGASTLDCTTGWTVSLTNYKHEDSVRVYLGTVEVKHGHVGHDGKFTAASDPEDIPLAATSHTLTVKVNDTLVAGLTKSADCTPASTTASLSCDAGYSVTMNNYPIGTAFVVKVGSTETPYTTDAAPYTAMDTTPLGAGTHTLTVLVGDQVVYTSDEPLTCGTPAPGPGPGPAPGPDPVAQAPTAVAAAEAVAPAVEPLPATVPEAEVPAIVPEAATVPEAEPVAVPEAATVPQAVPAGGGSSSNENGPSNALLLLVFAATAVCLGASARLLATRTR